nr:protein LURP-one-related 10-like [Ipomoea batatas]
MAWLHQEPFGNPNAVISPNFCAPHPFQLSLKKKHYFFRSQEPKNMKSKMIHMEDSSSRSKGSIPSSVARWSSMMLSKTQSLLYAQRNLDVFLRNNIAEKICDFKIKASNSANKCDIYGSSSLLIAQMKRKGILRTHFMMSVNPNVDYAFIVALIVILDEIANSD